MEFFHGTTDKLQIKKYILPPCETGMLREEWRKKFRNCVFFTPSFYSASKFAYKAARKYGGNPVVYKVKPLGLIGNTVNNEFVADKAIILEKIFLKER